MPDSNSDGFHKAGLVAIVVFLFALIVFQQSGYEYPEGVPNNYEASQYYDRANTRIEIECRGIDETDLVKCASEIEQAERNAHQAQKDLKAQRYMALWAFVMAATSTVAVVITGVGLRFIYLTLKASDRATSAAIEAVDVTRKIGEAQVRAYLCTKDTRYRRNGTFDRNGFEIGFFEGYILNSGQSPGRDVSIRTFGEAVSNPYKEWAPEFGEWIVTANIITSENKSWFAGVIAFQPSVLDFVEKGIFTIRIIMEIRFTDVFDKEFILTEKFYTTGKPFETGILSANPMRPEGHAENRDHSKSDHSKF